LQILLLLNNNILPLKHKGWEQQQILAFSSSPESMIKTQRILQQLTLSYCN